MRIALLEALEPSGGEVPFPRGFLRIAGASVVQHQLGLARALDCQRVICLARGQSPELISLQHSAEAAGMRFNIVLGPQQLSSLVTANDELIVITEGLVAEVGAVAALLGGTNSVVLSLPDDGAVAEGFERLDINNAAAGLMRIPGSIVERLHDLHADCDTISALTRIALQLGAEMRQIPAEQRISLRWNMVRSESEAAAIERAWLRTRITACSSNGLADRGARMAVLSFGSALLHAGNASGVASVGAIIALLLGVASAWMGSPVIAFIMAALAWVFVRTTELLRGAERQAYSVATPAITRADALGWLVDVGLVVICTMSMSLHSEVIPFARSDLIFAPLMLILTLHLTPRLLPGELSGWVSDRAVLSLILGLFAAVGYLNPVIRILAVALTVAAIVLPPRRSS